MGRPTDYTPETVAVILRALENGVTRKGAAAIAGVSKVTLYEWMKLYPEFANQVEQAQGTFMERAAKVIGGHAPSLIKWQMMLARDDEQLQPVADKVELDGTLITGYRVRIVDESDTGSGDRAPAAPDKDSEQPS